MGEPARAKKAAGIEILSGWKEIANYLGKAVRTVQRYEYELGLPVRRPAGKVRSSVLVAKVELDAWVSTAPIREEFRLTRAAGDNTSLLSQFRLNVERLHQLGQETQELQKELASSLKILQENIQATAARRSTYDSPFKSTAVMLMFDPNKKPT